MKAKVNLEEYKVTGEKLLGRVRELVHQGNIRRIIIKNRDGLTLIELPLTLGVVGAVLLPIWVAVGAVAALAADYRLVVEKIEEGPQQLSAAEPQLVGAGGQSEDVT